MANFPLYAAFPERAQNASRKMRSQMRLLLMLSAVPLLLVGTALGGALGPGEGIAVKITNDGTEDIVVTVYDMNTNPLRAVLANARINGFTSVPISLVADNTGKANLSWTASNADSRSPKCGHADTVVGNAAQVHVHADSSCSA
jgi:hypothetical protein